MPDNENPRKAAEGKLSLTPAELQEIVSAAISAAAEKTIQQSQEGFKAIADALLESRKPYKDPLQEANERSMRESMRKQRDDQLQRLKWDQENCPHIQGSNNLSDFPSPYGLGSIIHHILDSGEEIGICTNCTRIFRSCDPDYREFMTKKSGNRTSAAGRRFFPHADEAVRAGRG